MSASIELYCPRCHAALVALATTQLSCTGCERQYPLVDDVLDLRADPVHTAAPAPLAPGALERMLQARASGCAFKSALEELLLALSDERADRLMLLLREARAGWHPLVSASGGELLFLGNAFSGAITPLANAGFVVTVLDRSPERARFAAYRSSALSPGRTRCAIGGDGPRLPFGDGAFDVIVREHASSGLEYAPSDASTPSGPDLAECARVCRGEIVWTADNRLAYKRSTGIRGEFRVRGPLAFARAALVPGHGERTLAGYRRALAAHGFDATRAFALYPDARDFSHVVALDAPTPGLTIGPMERKNRVKLAARELGLFPIFTPSFALIGGRAGTPSRSPRIDRMLAALAERIGEPTPLLDQLVSTRGNTAVLHTKSRDASETSDRGRWTLHVALSPKNVPQFERHHRYLGLLRARFPSVPVPEPLFSGAIDGVALTCERRARGTSAPQISGDGRRVAAMIADASAHFAELVVQPAEPLNDARFDEQIARRFELVARYAAVPSTVANLSRMLDEARARLIGRRVPLVIYHADLRSKHIQVDRAGHAIAYLDWGTAEAEGLPYFDLFHLVVHEHKQTSGLSIGDAWRHVSAGRLLRPFEREALDAYARAVGIDSGVVRAIEAMYPVLVAAMAETHWDYSRPRWLHRHFGV